jgi:imidazolonepropionase-like amidohydrolase
MNLRTPDGYASPFLSRFLLWPRLALVAMAVVAASGVQAQTPMSVARPPVPGAPAGATAFVDVAVVPMDRERVLTRQTVVVQQGWITALGPSDKVTVPTGAVRIDGRGQYLMPGLADMHVHLPFAVTRSAQTERSLFLLLANGVTTVRNMDATHSQNDDDDKAAAEEKESSKWLLQFRARAAAGEVPAPRIITSGRWMGPRHFSLGKTRKNAGPALGESAGWWRIEPGEVAGQIAAYQAAGYDFVKPYFEEGSLFDSVVSVSRRLGIPVAGHVPPKVTIEQALAARMRSIEHLTGYIPPGYLGSKNPADSLRLVTEILSASRIRGLAEATRRAGVWNCPTINLFQGRRYLPLRNQLVKALQDAGAGLLLGSDEHDPEHGVVYRELRGLAAAGLTPYQAFATGTRNAAAYFGTLDEAGTVAIGKRADLVLLQANPLDDLRHVVRPAGVMIGGRWLGREALDQGLAARGLEPAPSYWQSMTQDAAEDFSALVGGLRLTAAQWKALGELKVQHEARQQALLDSLGSDDQFAVGSRRLRELIQTQFGSYRAVLTSEQQAVLDRRLRAWLR